MEHWSGLYYLFGLMYLECGPLWVHVRVRVQVDLHVRVCAFVEIISVLVFLFESFTPGRNNRQVNTYEANTYIRICL